MAITLRSGDTQSGEIAKENKVCMSGKVGISGKSGMSGQAGKSGVAGKLARCSVCFRPFGCLNRKPILASFSSWYGNNVAFPVELNWFWNNVR